MDAAPSPPSFAADMPRGTALARLRHALASAGIENPALDARILVADALGVAAAALLAHPEIPLGTDGARTLAEHAGRRLAREPVARIVGRAEFWGLPFRLSPETLVPRPDTETLVEAALGLAPRNAELRILDLGTGSGCILAALLHERPRALGLALDRSPAALATARSNFAANGVGGRAWVVAGDWDAALAGPFDLLVSNPPYIPDDAIAGLDPEVARHDPTAALAGGPDGLVAVRAVLAAAGRRLAPGGHALVEFGHDQGESVAALARNAGFSAVRIVHDLGGRARVAVIGPTAAL